MFVPLDRLYDFLDQYVEDDAIIYHFYPHGSRKCSDIRPLPNENFKNWQKIMLSVPLLMHDQEPLNFDYYGDVHDDDILDFLQTHEPSLLETSRVANQTDYLLKLYRTYNINMIGGSYLTDRWLLCHSEKKSLELLKYESIGAIGIYWWSHALIARDWYRYAQVDKKLHYNVSNFLKDFNVYNRAWKGTREYRLKFTEMIVQNDLVNSTSISFNEFDDQCYYRDHVFKNKAFAVDSDLSILDKNQFLSTASADYYWPDYYNSSIDVVLETLFDDARIHLTEKILRPIACGKPFILVSTTGSLQYLRDYGFETFNEYIDEDYDLISDPLNRLQHIINLMKHISQLSKNGKKNLYTQLHLIAERNKKRFWSEEFAQKIIGEFMINFEQSFKICKDSQNGKRWIENRKKLANQHSEFRKFLCRDNSFRTRKDIAELFLKIKKRSFI